MLGNPGLLAGTMRYFRASDIFGRKFTSRASTLTEPVPEVVKFRPADWPENIFLANQRDGIRPLLELVR